MNPTLKKMFDLLHEAYGPRHWWPADSPFEVVVGAILVQNTSWQNVKRAIDRLRSNDLLEPRALATLPLDELEELIRSAGYYRVKARRLHNLLTFLVERYDGSLEEMFHTDLPDLREALLEINGVGPETADSILLYAGGLPTFVVDAYTHRVLARHGWIEYDADYYAIQDFFTSGLPQDAVLFNEFHALMVELGKRHCRKRARCEGCPLSPLLPPGGLREPD